MWYCAMDNTTMMQVLWWEGGSVDLLHRLRATQRGHCDWHKGNTEATSFILVSKWTSDPEGSFAVWTSHFFPWYYFTIITGYYEVPPALSLPTHKLCQQHRAEVWSHGSEGMPGVQQKGEWDHAAKPHPNHHGDRGGGHESVRSHLLQIRVDCCHYHNSRTICTVISVVHCII